MEKTQHRVHFRRHMSENPIQAPKGILKKYGRSQSVYNLPDPTASPPSISRSNSSGSSWSLTESTESSGSLIRKLRRRSKSRSRSVEGIRFSFSPCLSGDIDAIDSQGRSLLFYAVRYGKEDTTRLLIEAGCYVNQQDTQGLTPLHEAIGRGHLDVATILLNEGDADPNVCDHSGETPLLMAVSRGQLDVVRLLHKYGADINKCDSTGTSPFCIALSKGWCDMAEFLLDKQCDVNNSSSNETTCLYRATQNTRIDLCVIAKRLLKTDYDFKQDSEWLSNENCVECMQLDTKLHNKILERAGLRPKTRRRSLLSSGKKKIVKIYKKSF